MSATYRRDIYNPPHAAPTGSERDVARYVLKYAPHKVHRIDVYTLRDGLVGVTATCWHACRPCMRMLVGDLARRRVVTGVQVQVRVRKGRR